ncbi:dUTP diphosphatase [Melioribacteraceae bacterium 4301-Me]|uniref:dUTP diphosphatase n=1 Tax=Pyranulibacter aquaticus TaxID=3163344 RepID=UPI003594DC3D
MEKIQIKIKRVQEKFNNIPLPEYATEGSSGLDIRAAIDEDFVLKSKQFALIPTNMSVEIPEGFEMQIRPRSGLAAKNGIGVLNSPGTIDSDYRGEIKVILFNFGNDDFIIKPGDRIAQMILTKVWKADFIEVKELNNSKRGEGGFGHTGKF